MHARWSVELQAQIRGLEGEWKVAVSMQMSNDDGEPTCDQRAASSPSGSAVPLLEPSACQVPSSGQPVIEQQQPAA